MASSSQSNYPIALTIAGSDPSGGAGLQADLKTFHQHRVFGTSVVTLLTVQNTQGVEAVQQLDPEFVRQQFVAVESDVPPNAVKTGALGSAAIIDVVAECVQSLSCPIVVDPVMVSKHGHSLVDQTAIEVLQAKLLPHAFLVTPNRHEAERLTGVTIADKASMECAAQRIQELGAANVLIKGGRLRDAAVDLLLHGDTMTLFETPYIPSTHTHGSGCVLSASITAGLAYNPLQVIKAIETAKDFVHQGILTAPSIGRGHGPLNLHVDVPR